MASAILASLKSDLSSALSAGVSAAPALGNFFTAGLLTWGTDEVKILYDAIDALITKLESGSSWEEAATAAYNDFYNEELSEGKKIALAFLNIIAQVAKVASEVAQVVEGTSSNQPPAEPSPALTTGA